MSTPQVGDVINEKYELLEELGSGSMGIVFKALHRFLRAFVAIKFINPGLLGDKNARRRFVLEAQIGTKIRHPGVVSVFDIESNGYVFIVMEYLEGKELDEIINDAGCIVEAKFAIEIVSQILEALQEVHKQDVIHRDLKPANIFLTNAGQVKIMDFGIAKARSEALATTQELTNVGTTLGTPYYMSPEQAAGSRALNHQADLWSVGVMLYEMLTGCIPFPGSTHVEVLNRIQEGVTNRPRTLNPDIPEELERIILRAMQPKPRNRYQSAEEFLDDLESLSDSEESTVDNSTPTPTPIPPSPSPVPVYDAETVIVQRKKKEAGSETQLSVKGFAPSFRQRYGAIAILLGVIVLVGVIFSWQMCSRNTAETDHTPVVTPTSKLISSDSALAEPDAAAVVEPEPDAAPPSKIEEPPEPPVESPAKHPTKRPWRQKPSPPPPEKRPVKRLRPILGGEKGPVKRLRPILGGEGHHYR